MQIAMRSYFSSNHVSAAQLFASRATEIEDSHSGRSRFDMNHRAFVLGAVVELAVFLECAINELYKDCLDGHGAYISTLSQASIAALASEWTNWHAKGRTYKPTLDKYEAALATCGATAFNWGCQTCQDATLLVKLRNTLVHYTPESIVANDPHKLGDALRPKFQENRLMQGSGNPYFPDKCLGAGCADWAIKVALSFANDFFDRIGVKPNYQRI